MASPDLLDFAKLLAPIAGEKLAGIDLRADPSPNSAYYAIKDARNAARAGERQIVVDGEEGAKPVDWRPVLQHGTKALAEQSKDLEIAVYVIEALVRLHGFAGLRDGFRLARELTEQFWDQLYPLPDEEGLETRVAPLTGLNGDDAEGTLISPIAKVPLTDGSSAAGPFAYYHYQQASALGQMADEEAREKRIKQGAVSMPMLEKAVAETPGSFFTNLVDDLTQCQDEFAKLCVVMDDKCGSKAPPASSIRSALIACLDTVSHIARDKLAAPKPAAAAAEDATATPVGANGAAAAPKTGPDEALGAIGTRDGAFRTLLKVAEFFRRTEPHTPVSYALEQAVRWGRMSLPELLSELIPDEAPRQQFFKQVGIRLPEQSSG
jgi:type VI secretion system protein ImpA